MGTILKHIADQTEGKCFSSFKYCLEGMPVPSIEYGDNSDSYINMKEFAESLHDPKIRDLSGLSKALSLDPPLFKFFLDGSRRAYKVDDIQYDKKVYPVICGQISVSCCRRDNNDDNSFKSFSQVFGEAYPVVCLPVNANGEGVDNKVFFSNLCSKINEIPFIKNSGYEFGKALYYCLV